MIHERGEADEWGEIFHALNTKCRLSYGQIGDMTWVQCLNALYQGKPPRPGTVKWNTSRH